MKMKKLLVFVALIALSFAASAYTLFPSAISGDYVGSNFSCRVLATGFGNGTHVVLDIRCTLPSHQQTIGRSVLYGGCVSTDQFVPLTRWDGTDFSTSLTKNDWISLPTIEALKISEDQTVYGYGLTNKFPLTWARLVSATGPTIGSFGQLTIRVGSSDEVIAGGGTLLVLSKVQNIVPPIPYAGCGLSRYHREIKAEEK